jgi:hypothetical protein
VSHGTGGPISAERIQTSLALLGLEVVAMVNGITALRADRRRGATVSGVAREGPAVVSAGRNEAYDE